MGRIAQPGGSVTTVTSPSTAAVPRTRRQRAAEAALGLLLSRRGGTAGATLTQDIRIPMRDGMELLADHYAPKGTAAGTVLIRSPYGTGALLANIFAGPYIAGGYHVLLSRCRGTFGSGGVFDPMVHEVDDT